jgi:TonB family protein
MQNPLMAEPTITHPPAQPLLRGITGTLLLLTLATAAAHAQGRDGLLGDTPSPEGRRCEVAVAPRALRSAAALLDSTALHQALAASAEPATAVYSIRFDDRGAVEWVRTLGGGGEAVAGADLRPLVQQHVRPGTRAREPWSVRVQVRAGPEPEVRVGRSEVCPAARTSSSGGAGQTIGQVTPQEMAELRTAGPFRIGVLVGPSGEIVRVRVIQSSRSRIQDDMAVRAAHQGRYQPELVDGFPVEAWFEIRARARR